MAALLALLMISSAYFLALRSYQKESEDEITLLLTGDVNRPDRVDMVAQILSLDPLRGEARIRLSLFPRGNLSRGFSCVNTLRLQTPGAAHISESHKVLAKGSPLDPLDLSYVLEGQVNDYPFDLHTVLLAFSLNRTDPDEVVPSTLMVRGNVPGYRIELTPLEGLTPGFRILNMTVTRSSTVMNAALAGMAVMWAIGLGVLALIALLLSGWYNVRMPALFAALLFGLFGLRNSLPGTPPIGTYSDFLAFLWVQGIVALALVVALAATLRHRPV